MAEMKADARSKLLRDAVAAAEKLQGERERFPWKTGFHTSVVVELPVEAVLLNPRSHRIRSQLESHAGRNIVQTDPYGETAQEIIASLLRKTEGFEELRANLKSVQQREPGIATHAGLLINANTRCVALRDNGADYIRVAILPEDAQQKEIDRLELRLQLQQDFRQDYSFSNQLLFVEDLLLRYEFTDERVAMEMNWGSESDPGSLREGAKLVQSHVRMLATARELQLLGGDRLPLTWLDDKRQAMIDLDGEIEKLAKKDDGAAKALKNNRLLGMLAGVYYRELREVDQYFAEQYLIPYLEEKPLFQGRIEELLRPPAQPGVALKGLDVFDAVSPPPFSPVDVEPLVVKLAESHDQKSLRWKDSQAQDIDEERASVVAELLDALNDAALEARDDRKLGRLQDRPRKLVEQASKSIRRATEAYQRASSHTDFKHEAFATARSELGAALAALDAISASPPE